MQIPKKQLLAVLFFLPITAFSQVLDHIDIRLVIREKSGNQILPLPNAKLKISDEGEVLTDLQGRYNFTYPVRNNVDPEISIALLSDKHKVLKPIDNSIELDASREEMTIELLVVNMAEENPEFQKRIRDLENRISRLQSRNELTKQQLNALQSKLVDTLLFFEANRLELEAQIAGLKSASDSVKAENKALLERLAGLEQEVGSLTVRLEEALEERYLRQNEHFKVISKNLLEYLQRLKDIRDELPFVKQYLSGGHESYNQRIKQYGDIFTVINTEHEGYLEAVERYWENQMVSKELEKILAFLLESVHLKLILPTFTQINTELKKQKPNSAQKIATANQEVIEANIKVLEKDVNRILKQMRKLQ